MRVNQVILPGMWHDVTPLFYGCENCSPGHSYGPAVRDCYLLHYILEGKGTFLRGGEAYSVVKGDIFVIRPGEVTTYQADEQEPWQYVWLGFAGSGDMPFLQEPVLRQVPVKHLFAYICDYAYEQGMEGKIFALTHELLWILSRSGRKDLRPGSRYAEYLKAYIDSGYMHSISMEEIARHLHVDRRYLTALFRERYGQSPQNYLTEYRLAKADSFLKLGHSVSEAASMAGFSDIANFSRRYKQEFGVSPSKNR